MAVQRETVQFILQSKPSVNSLSYYLLSPKYYVCTSCNKYHFKE